jgi:hypothetical protein
MEFSRLLEKLGRGQRLSEAEIFELRTHAKAIDDVKNAVKSWLSPGSADPRFRHMESETGAFWDVPLATFQLQRVAALTITNDLTTPVEFDDHTTPTPSLRLDTDGIKILIRPGKRYGLIGTVGWDGSSTGRRAAHVEVYDADDALLYGQVLYSLPAGVADSITMPFADALQGTTNAKYIKFTVYQNSGGDLDIDSIRVALFEVMGEKP